MLLTIPIIILSIITSVYSACTNTRCPDYDNDHKKNCDRYYYVSQGDSSLCACEKKIEVGYIEYPPYIYTGSDGNARGIWRDMIEKRVTIFCSANKASEIKWIKTSSAIQNTLDLCQIQKNDRDFIFGLPVVAPSTKDEQHNVLWNPIQEIQGVAYVTLKVEEWKMALDGFSGSIVDVWPFFLLAITAALLTGIMIWMLDSHKNKDDFPRTFRRGAYEGFWWSFVSMTTVGYGDKVPMSIAGRLFSVIWIIIGITIVSILTSMLSSGFTDSVAVEQENMKGKLVGYLDVTEHERQVISREEGVPLAASSPDELVRMLAVGEIEGFAMDSRQLSYYHKNLFSKFSHVEFRVQQMYQFDQWFGIAFWDRYFCDNSSPDWDIIDHDWHGCHKYFWERNNRFQQAMNGISLQATEADNMDPKFLEVKEYVANLFDTSSDQFWKFLKVLGVTIMCVVIVGLAFDVAVHYYGAAWGLHANKGYEKGPGVGDKSIPLTNMGSLTREEKAITELVDRTVLAAEEKLRTAESAIKYDIKNMSRSIRQEMLALKKRVDTVY